MLQYNIIPPQSGLTSRMNKGFPNLEQLHVRVPLQEVRLDHDSKSGSKKKILINSFDAAVSQLYKFSLYGIDFQIGRKHVLTDRRTAS